MKKLLLPLFVILICVACKDENPDEGWIYPEHILAGQSTGQEIRYSGQVNDTIFFSHPSAGESIPVDLNGDGSADFVLGFSGSVSPGHQMQSHGIRSLGLNALVVSDSGDALVDTLCFGDTISGQSNWFNDTCTLYSYYWNATGESHTAGLWYNAADKYIGARVIAGDKVLYGWIRVSIGNGWSLALIDFACTRGVRKE